MQKKSLQANPKLQNDAVEQASLKILGTPIIDA